MRSKRRKIKQGQIDHIYNYTYDELKLLKDNDGLVPEAHYIITDYVTKHRIPGTSVIHTGVLEPLLITAKSTSEFFGEAKSISFSDHSIEYRFDLNVCEDNSTPRPGMIVSRNDTSKRTYIGFDYLNVVSRWYKVLSKVYNEVVLGTVGVSTTEYTIESTSNTPGLSNRLRYEVRFANHSHPSGTATIVLNYANGSITKPLRIHEDNSEDVTENYFSEKKGTIIYNPDLDAFVLMSFKDIGVEMVGQYASPQPTTYTVGYGGISYNVNALDFQDYKLFQDNFNEVSIPSDHLSLGTDDYYPKSVFKGPVWRFSVGSYIRNVCFGDDMVRTYFGDIIENSSFLGAHYDMKVDKSVSNALMLPAVGGFGIINHKFYDLLSVTITPVHNLHALAPLAAVSLIFEAASNFLSTATISESNFFLSGVNVGGAVPNNCYITAPIYRSLVGYVSSFSWHISKILNNQTLFTRINLGHNGENLLGGTKVDTLSIDTLQTPVGVVNGLGIDEDGQVVSYKAFATLPDGLIFLEDVVVTDNDVSISKAEWRIDNLYYGLEESITSVPLPTAGTTRIDRIVGNVSDELVLVLGTEAILPEVAVGPDVPDNTVEVLEVFSTDAGVDTVTESALSSYVRFDINGQGLSPYQRLSARNNIQAVSKDTFDTRTGGLTQTGNLLLLTGEDGSASSYILRTQNTNGGGIRVQRRGSLTVFAKGDSTTDYHVIRGADTTGLTVFEVRGGGITKGGDGINDDDFATIGQLNAAVIAGGGGAHTHPISDVTNLQTELDAKVLISGDTMTGPLIIESGADSLNVSSIGLIFDRSTSYLRPNVHGSINLNLGGSAQGELDWATVKLFASVQFLYNGNHVTSGSGTQNYLPKFDATGRIVEDSQIFDDGSNIGIGTSSPLHKLEIVEDSANFLQILRDGVASTQGFFKVVNYTSGVGVIAPIFWSKSNSEIYPGMAFISDVLTGMDTGEVPIVRVQGRQNNTNVVNRPILGVENGPTGINLFRVHADGRVQIHNINNATGDILHVSASGVVTKRTLAELKTDLGVDFTEGYVTISGPTQVITGQKEFDLNISTKQAFHIESNTVLNRKTGYASINYNSAGSRFYFGRPDEVDLIQSLGDLTADRVVTWQDKDGTPALLDLTISDKSADYTLTQADNGQIVEVSAAATITLPDGLSTGFNCNIVNTGVGIVTLTATTTLRNGVANKINTQYKGCTVYHAGANVWQAIGTEE